METRVIPLWRQPDPTRPHSPPEARTLGVRHRITISLPMMKAKRVISVLSKFSISLHNSKKLRVHNENLSLAPCRSNCQLRNTLHKARTLCDKWRFQNIPANSADLLESPGNHGRLSRWFSIRRGSTHHYDVDSSDTVSLTSPVKTSQMPQLCEVSIVCLLCAIFRVARIISIALNYSYRIIVIF